MKIVNKTRGRGKTWDLIKEASENKGVIICANKQSVSNIENRMYRMWVNGVIGYRPDVVHVDMIRGRKLEGKKKYIDEIDYFIESALGFKPDYATMTGEIEDYTKKKSIAKNQTVKPRLNVDKPGTHLINNHQQTRSRSVGELTIDLKLNFDGVDDYMDYLRLRTKSNDKIIIFTNSEDKARSVIGYYMQNYECKTLSVGERSMYIDLKDGRRVEWVKPTTNARGHRCSEAYIDKDIDEEIMNMIRPMCIHCTPETMRII